jgi:hypothetical protein|tara:strand:+ start:1666 stop:2148 length:483 start_codon:yes stop_codon:yes gene_type:complete
MVKIKDNFIDKQKHEKILKTMCSSEFPWYYNNYKVRPGDNNFQMTHTLYRNHAITSPFFQLINPVLDKLKAKALVGIKCNLTFVTPKKIIYGMHTDFDAKCKTAVYYVNSNNGITLFKNKQSVASLENRMVIFSSDSIHTGVSHTDKKIRLVINLNYYDK